MNEPVKGELSGIYACHKATYEMVKFALYPVSRGSAPVAVCGMRAAS